MMEYIFEPYNYEEFCQAVGKIEHFSKVFVRHDQGKFGPTTFRQPLHSQIRSYATYGDHNQKLEMILPGGKVLFFTPFVAAGKIGLEWLLEGEGTHKEGKMSPSLVRPTSEKLDGTFLFEVREDEKFNRVVFGERDVLNLDQVFVTFSEGVVTLIRVVGLDAPDWLAEQSTKGKELVLSCNGGILTFSAKVREGLPELGWTFSKSDEEVGGVISRFKPCLQLRYDEPPKEPSKTLLFQPKLDKGFCKNGPGIRPFNLFVSVDADSNPYRTCTDINKNRDSTTVVDSCEPFGDRKEGLSLSPSEGELLSFLPVTLGEGVVVVEWEHSDLESGIAFANGILRVDDLHKAVEETLTEVRSDKKRVRQVAHDVALLKRFVDYLEEREMINERLAAMLTGPDIVWDFLEEDPLTLVSDMLNYLGED